MCFFLAILFYLYSLKFHSRLEMIDEDSDIEEKSSSQPKLTIVEGINISPTQSIPDDIMDKM